MAYVYASLADILAISKEYGVDDVELILTEIFGFDKESTKMDGDTWYEISNCTHRSSVTNEIVTCDRYVGIERLDNDWLTGKRASFEAQVESKKDISLNKELASLGQRYIS